MKKLRLILFEQCNRDCALCVNEQMDIVKDVPIFYASSPAQMREDFSKYPEVIITGGEPMLHPGLVTTIAQIIKEADSRPNVWLHTAHSRNPWLLLSMLHWVDGITLTIHEQKDVEPLRVFNTLLRKLPKNHSMKLCVFEGIDLGDINLDYWHIKDNIKWLEECPLPEDEVLMRLDTEVDQKYPKRPKKKEIACHEIT